METTAWPTKGAERERNGGDIDRKRCRSLILVDLFLRLDGSSGGASASVLLVRSIPQSSNHLRHPLDYLRVCGVTTYRQIESRLWMRDPIDSSVLVQPMFPTLPRQCIHTLLDTTRQEKKEPRGSSQVHEREGIVLHCFHEGSFNRIWQIETVATVDNERRPMSDGMTAVNFSRLELMQLHWT
jgi:hypothetical protein